MEDLLPTTVAYVSAGLIISAISKQERIIRLNTFGFVAARYHSLQIHGDCGSPVIMITQFVEYL